MPGCRRISAGGDRAGTAACRRKRYLCATEADYFAKLSPDSVKSLALQGGPMSAEEVAAFDALPHHAAAVQLRRYDEQAKVKGLETPPVAHFMPAVARCLKG